MNNSSRDLLVLFNQELMTPKAIENEVEKLHEILHLVEQLDNIINAHEVIDINKFKIFKNKNNQRFYFIQKTLTPFVFFNCKN